MDNVLAIGAIVSASVAVLTLACAIWSIRRLSEQTDLLRKQIFGEVYETAQIKSLQFFLPAKANRPIAVFEEIQKEDEEVVLGQEIKISRRWETELHVQFWMDAPQRLRLISWGFPASVGEDQYPDRPNIMEYRRPFASEITSRFEREVYQDWHGYWHIEFPFPRLLPKEYCLTICFTIKGDRPGKFPLEFEITTDEAKGPHKECLWIEVTN
jgi:hypothetical protein